MNKFFKAALLTLLLFVLPALAFADAPVMLVDLPESAQMVEDIEFEGGDFIQTYQLEDGVTVQLLRYAGFSLTIDELIASDWSVNCGVEMGGMTELSGYPAQRAHVLQAVDADGYAVRKDGKESGVMEIDLVLVNVEGTALIFQSIRMTGEGEDAVAAILESLQLQAADSAEVG